MLEPSKGFCCCLRGLTVRSLVLHCNSISAPSQCTHPQRLCLPDVQVKDSYVAGKGVFARKDIPKGTRIGAYPGRPRSVPQILIKAETAPAAKGFAFHTSTGGPARAGGAPAAPWAERCGSAGDLHACTSWPLHRSGSTAALISILPSGVAHDDRLQSLRSTVCRLLPRLPVALMGSFVPNLGQSHICLLQHFKGLTRLSRGLGPALLPPAGQLLEPTGSTEV